MGGGWAGTNAAAAMVWTKDPVHITVPLAGLGFTGPVQVRELWTHTDLGTFPGDFTPVIPSHGAGLYRVSAAMIAGARWPRRHIPDARRTATAL